MKMVRNIGEWDVMVIVDPDATHNFISVATVEKLGLTVEKERNLG